jgi:positive regulator of sigma E activity
MSKVFYVLVVYKFDLIFLIVIRHLFKQLGEVFDWLTLLFVFIFIIDFYFKIIRLDHLEPKVSEK